MENKDIVICYAKRTAIGSFGGSLLPYNASKLLSLVIILNGRYSHRSTSYDH
ncbi:MAG: hypothetical protein ACTSQD_07730 [Promethearchaeota archaeon]